MNNNNNDLNTLIDKVLEAKTKYFFASLDKIAPDSHVQTAKNLYEFIDEKLYEIIPLDYLKDIFLINYHNQELKSKYLNFKANEEKERIINIIENKLYQTQKKPIFIINNLDIILSYFKSRNNGEFDYCWELLINNSIYSQICIFLVSKHLAPNINSLNYTHSQREFKNVVEKIILEKTCYVQA